MADELIRCPSCNHELRLPSELLGQTVECPQCGSRFAAPAPSRAPMVRPVGQAGLGYDDSGPQAPVAGPSLRAPAIALLIVSGLAALLQVYSIANAEENVAKMRQLAQDP